MNCGGCDLNRANPVEHDNSTSPLLLSCSSSSFPLLSPPSLELSSSHFWSFDNLRWLHRLQCISHSVGNSTIDQQEDPLSYNGQALTTGLIPASSGSRSLQTTERKVIIILKKKTKLLLQIIPVSNTPGKVSKGWRLSTSSWTGRVTSH